MAERINVTSRPARRSLVFCIPRLPIKKSSPSSQEPSEEREGLLMYLHLHHHLLHQLVIGAVLICRCCLSGHDGNSRNDSVRSWHLTIYRYWCVDWIFFRYYWQDAYPSWSIQNTIHNSWYFTNYAAKLQLIIDITKFILQKNYKLYQSSYFFTTFYLLFHFKLPSPLSSQGTKRFSLFIIPNNSRVSSFSLPV